MNGVSWELRDTEIQSLYSNARSVPSLWLLPRQINIVLTNWYLL